MVEKNVCNENLGDDNEKVDDFTAEESSGIHVVLVVKVLLNKTKINHLILYPVDTNMHLPERS